VWTRGIAGVVVFLAGVVWIAQGTGAMKNSSMSGHGEFTVLGVVALIAGAALVVWGARVRRRAGQITD
jgi:uncharacterized membrane protein HdeD (DUF308 family)